jgi:hypothetical protein
MARWFAMLVLAAGAALHCAPVSAECVELLRVEAMGTAEGQGLTLSSCDAGLDLVMATPSARIAIQLHDPAASAWRAALGPGAPLSGAMLAGRLSVASATGALPDGLLLSSHSARADARHSWLWTNATATLRLDPAAPPSAPECPEPRRILPLLWHGVREVAPGGMVIPAVRLEGNAGIERFSQANCPVSWSVSDITTARVHPTLGLAVVPADARDGVEFEMRATMPGAPGAVTAVGRVRVVDPGRQRLTGRWTHVEEKVCGTATWRPATQRVGELQFGADGQFSVTWQPSGGRRDYWGRYEHDTASGKLTMEVTGGSNMPYRRLSEGIATLDHQGTLVVGRRMFDSGSAAMPPCEVKMKRLQ